MSTEKDAKRPCHEDSEERTLNRGWIEDAWHDDPADEADDAEDARSDSDARGLGPVFSWAFHLGCPEQADVVLESRRGRSA
jgi:hypothetical protein